MAGQQQNAGDRRQVEEAGRKERAALNARASDLKTVLDLVEGRRLLYRIMEELCGVHTEDFDPNPQVSAYNQGVRKLGVMIRREIKGLDPAYLPTMEKDYQQQEAKIHG